MLFYMLHVILYKKKSIPMKDTKKRDDFLKNVLDCTGEKGTTVKLFMQSMKESTAWLESQVKS